MLYSFRFQHKPKRLMLGGSVDWSYFFGLVCPIFTTDFFWKFVDGTSMYREILAVFFDNWPLAFDDACCLRICFEFFIKLIFISVVVMSRSVLFLWLFLFHLGNRFVSKVSCWCVYVSRGTGCVFSKIGSLAFDEDCCLHICLAFFVKLVCVLPRSVIFQILMS